MINRWEHQTDYCLEGRLLVAAPHWQHELFARSVCLVIHHSSKGAIGVFLNRNLAVDAPGLWQQLAGEEPVNKLAAINFGGPHSGPVVAVHSRRELAEFTSADGVYFAAQIQHLRQLVTSSGGGDSPVKIIIGQADWSSGCLDQEFAEGKWLPLAVSPALVFADPTDMWSQAMREIGNQYVLAITGCRGLPADLRAN